jgi:hypothetical protein
VYLVLERLKLLKQLDLLLLFFLAMLLSGLDLPSSQTSKQRASLDAQFSLLLLTRICHIGLPRRAWQCC